MKMEQARARREEILRRHANGEGPTSIAKALGIRSRQSVERIVSKRSDCRSTYYTAESTRLTRRSMYACHSLLGDKPRCVYVRVMEDSGWSIGVTQHEGSHFVGVFTSAIPFAEFVKEAEHVAEEMAPMFWRVVA